jgi:hypothetical protein
MTGSAFVPPLPPTAADAKGFVPPGWVLEASVAGDLDGDGTSDLAFVLRQTNKANILANPDGPGEAKLDTNPRILGVALGAGQRRMYRLVQQDHGLIPRHEAANLSDAFDGIKPGRNAFNLELELFANAGGWDTSKRRMTFRMIGGRCVLIGYDDVHVVRNTGAMTHTSINYLTRRRVVETSKVDQDRPDKVRTDMLKPGPLLALGQIGDGLEFEPKP